MWIGLHSLQIGSSYTWVYGKPSCHQVDGSVQDNWASGEPKNEDTSRCGVQDLASGEWSVRKCQWTIYKFLCEKQESKFGRLAKLQSNKCYYIYLIRVIEY